MDLTGQNNFPSEKSTNLYQSFSLSFVERIKDIGPHDFLWFERLSGFAVSPHKSGSSDFSYLNVLDVEDLKITFKDWPATASLDAWHSSFMKRLCSLPRPSFNPQSTFSQF